MNETCSQSETKPLKKGISFMPKATYFNRMAQGYFMTSEANKMISNLETFFGSKRAFGVDRRVHLKFEEKNINS